MKTLSARTIFFFCLILSLLLTAAGALHYLVIDHLGYPAQYLMLQQAYVSNFILAIILFVPAYFFRNILSGNLAYLFLAGGVVKAAVFLSIFRPHYTSDGQLSKIEFLAFFIPFGLSLAVETYALIRAINRSDK